MRDILSVTDTYRKWGNGVRYACELSALLDVRLTGMFVVEPIVPLSPSPLPVVTAQIPAASAEAAQAAVAAGPEFEKFATAAGARHCRWLVGNGALAATVAQAACWHDLLVAESGAGSAWGSAGVLGQLLLGSDLPCIIVPGAWTKQATLDTVAIAWNGSGECVRAMHAALPLLERAKRVLLLVGAHKELYSIVVSMNPPFSPETHLHQHGIAFERIALETSDAGAGAALLSVAKDTHTDLLVMGAYGHTRFSEWVLGGATRHVLQHACLPVLMRH